MGKEGLPWLWRAFTVKENVIRKPLVNRDYIILFPLHIKLGLIKQFVKALDEGSAFFSYISWKIPGVSNEKLK